MSYARKTLVSLNDTPYYWWKRAPAFQPFPPSMAVMVKRLLRRFDHFHHPWRSHVVARCVRRGWLWGVDEYAGRDYSHRKVWVLERLAIDRSGSDVAPETAKRSRCQYPPPTERQSPSCGHGAIDACPDRASSRVDEQYGMFSNACGVPQGLASDLIPPGLPARARTPVREVLGSRKHGPSLPCLIACADPLQRGCRVF